MNEIYVNTSLSESEIDEIKLDAMFKAFTEITKPSGLFYSCDRLPKECCFYLIVDDKAVLETIILEPDAGCGNESDYKSKLISDSDYVTANIIRDNKIRELMQEYFRLCRSDSLPETVLQYILRTYSYSRYALENKLYILFRYIWKPFELHNIDDVTIRQIDEYTHSLDYDVRYEVILLMASVYRNELDLIVIDADHQLSEWLMKDELPPTYSIYDDYYDDES